LNKLADKLVVIYYARKNPGEITQSGVLTVDQVAAAEQLPVSRKGGGTLYL
jgi:hypothetical protein